MKQILKIVLTVLIVIVVAVGGYAVYFVANDNRIGDCELEVTHSQEKAEKQTDFTLISWNIGFGAYEHEYSFFMSGGKESRAKSLTSLQTNLVKIVALLEEADCDFYLIQEIDTDATRTFGYNELQFVQQIFDGYASTYAVNFHSPYILYPFTEPFGYVNSGMVTISKQDIASASRHELPVQDGIGHFVDLDRCYSKSYIELADGKTLVLYNFHLTAYTSDDTLANRQLQVLLDDMEKEYKNGSYCVAGGDCNMDLLGNSGEVFGWSDTFAAHITPLPKEIFNGYNVELIAPLGETATCRYDRTAYYPDKINEITTIDGFLVTSNVTVNSATVVDTDFQYSDHNPVRIEFSVK